MSHLPWFRMYAEFATDPIIRALSFEDRAHFIMALCLKANGSLDKAYPTPEIRREILAQMFGLNGEGERNGLDAANARLRKYALVDADWQPTNWEKRQMRSDSSADRVRKFRENKRNEAVTHDVTDTKRYSNGLDIDKDIDSEKIRGEPRAKRATASRLPPDFALTAERATYASEQRLDPKRTFENFVDYWTAASGAKARKHDWDATWRTWCRNDADRKAAPVSRFGQPQPPATNDAAAWAEAKSAAAAIGFRAPAPTETASSYLTAVKLASNRPRQVPLSERLGLAGIKRLNA